MPFKLVIPAACNSAMMALCQQQFGWRVRIAPCRGCSGHGGPSGDRLAYRAHVPDELSFEALYDDPFVVAVGARSPWAHRRKIELAELTDEWWAMPPLESDPGSFFAEVFRAKGLDYPRAKVVSFPIGVRTSLLATSLYPY
jgi:hypothetical protein